MELVWLEDFLALADARNFSRAAEARNVTQPAFSRRIRAFENWIGAEMFTRGSRGVSLTAAGEHVLAHAGEIVRRIHDLRREVRALSGREAMPCGSPARTRCRSRSSLAGSGGARPVSARSV